jgi:hypothetical protein
MAVLIPKSPGRSGFGPQLGFGKQGGEDSRFSDFAGAIQALSRACCNPLRR